ncbi:MAG: type II toxin-antitoxin system VapC family toxin [Calditrichaeota bacterium]|nr:type II toxin-antitoxin system VapC family toxin [Calditrichota bacterium]
MIALDSNVLLRFLIEDDADQTARAAELIRKTIVGNDVIYVSDIVLCEIVWVLKRLYRKSKPEIIKIIRLILLAEGLVFNSTEAIWKALDAYEHGRGDFADYIIREQARDAGSEVVATFDKVLISEKGFIAP